jgi:hypothetical protein
MMLMLCLALVAVLPTRQEPVPTMMEVQPLQEQVTREVTVNHYPYNLRFFQGMVIVSERKRDGALETGFCILSLVLLANGYCIIYHAEINAKYHHYLTFSGVLIQSCPR